MEDLSELEKLTGNDRFLEGKICIARYGKIFRGNKVHNCQNKGAIGNINGSIVVFKFGNNY